MRTSGLTTGTFEGSARTAAILGAGAAGLLHALAYRAHGVDVALVLDPDSAQAQALAELCGAETCADVDAIARSGVDCVSVCSPPRVHVEQALACAREGRLVFVEKPIAVSRAELDRIAAAPGCVPIVQWRWGRALRAVRRAIALGLLGGAPTVSLDLAWRRDAAYFRKRAPGAWGCGALLSVGIHAIDALCYALDRPVLEVSGATNAEDGAPETSAVALATFAGGACAAVRATFEGGPDETRLSFCGAGVTAAIVGSEADPTAAPVHWSCEDESTLRRLREIEEGTDGAMYGPLIVPYIGRALAAARERLGRPCDACPSVRDVAAAHELVMRIYERAGSPLDRMTVPR
jgi:predicted dehydrogenase